MKVEKFVSMAQEIWVYTSVGLVSPLVINMTRVYLMKILQKKLFFIGKLIESFVIGFDTSRVYIPSKKLHSHVQLSYYKCDID